MKDRGKVQGIIFDLDGTLYEYRWLKLQLMFRNISSLPNLARLEAGRDGIRHASFPSQSHLVAEASRISRPGNPKAFQLWYEQRFYPSFVSLLKPRMLRPGTEDLLRQLQAQNIKLSVCSDYGRVPERLQALGLEPSLFHNLTSAEDCGHLKPQLFSYRTILKEFKLDAHEVLIVGDRVETDGIAAQELGCRFYEIRKGEDWSHLIKLVEESQ